MFVDGPSMDVWSPSASQTRRVADFLEAAEGLGLRVDGDTPDGNDMSTQARGPREKLEQLAELGYELLPDQDDPEYDTWYD